MACSLVQWQLPLARTLVTHTCMWTAGPWRGTMQCASGRWRDGSHGPSEPKKDTGVVNLSTKTAGRPVIEPDGVGRGRSASDGSGWHSLRPVRPEPPPLPHRCVGRAGRRSAWQDRDHRWVNQRSGCEDTGGPGLLHCASSCWSRSMFACHPCASSQ